MSISLHKTKLSRTGRCILSRAALGRVAASSENCWTGQLAPTCDRTPVSSLTLSAGQFHFLDSSWKPRIGARNVKCGCSVEPARSERMFGQGELS